MKKGENKKLKLKIMCILPTIISVILVNCIFLIISSTSSNEVEYTNRASTKLGDIILKTKASTLEAGKTISIEMYLEGQDVATISGYLGFDESKFEELEAKDVILANNRWNVYIGSEDPDLGGRELSLFGENNDAAISDGLVATINLKLKEDIERMDFSINYLELTNTSYESSIGEEDEFIPSVSLSIVSRNDMYLTSETYKIGKDNINNYEEGDQYISRVRKETTLEQFIDKLDTNGIIKVLKQDNTELTLNEFVGTGMKLSVTNGTDTITLPIAVMGDISGEGKVTAQDLSAVNHGFLDENLTGIYFVAADFDENGRISATDLSEEQNILLSNDESPVINNNTETNNQAEENTVTENTVTENTEISEETTNSMSEENIIAENPVTDNDTADNIIAENIVE